MYADEGITGTSTVHRTEFKRLIADCNAGKIDVVLVKSISRFARDTVDCLHTVRRLKEKGIAVHFERENIDSTSEDGEFLLTILSSLLQEEARSISENVTWGLRKRFADGKFSVGYSRFLGYDKGEDGNLAINEEQAKIVLCDTTTLAEERAKLQQELAVLVEMTEKCIRENARIVQNQEEYQKRYEGLVARYDAAKARFDEVTEAISAKEAQSERLALFIKCIKEQSVPAAEFDSQLWASMVECVTVDNGMTVVFRDGTEVMG